MADVVRLDTFIGAGVDLTGVKPSGYVGPIGALEHYTLLEGASVSGNPNVSFVQLPDAVGSFTEHYLFDFYNRIWLSPDYVDFGTINVNESQTFSVWNAYFVSKTLTSVTPPLDTSVTTSVVGGTTLAALELRDYSVTAFASGPAKLDASFIFNFSGANSVTLNVGGSRAEVWPFRPDFASPWRVSYEFKTEVITSRSGVEQRRALRIRPRKTIEFKATTKGDSFIDLKRMLTRWQNGRFILPEISRKIAVTTDIASGTSVIPVSEVPFWAVAGRDIIIQRPISPYKWEQSVHGIQSVNVGTNTITITNATDFDWTAGTAVHPALLCLMEPETSLTSITSTVGEINVRFSVDPTYEPNPINPTTFTTFDGREVITKSPNWSSNPVTDFIYPYEQVDFGRGAIETIRPILFSTQSRRMTYLSRTSADAEEMLAQFMRAKGQRSEFFTDSGEPDIIPSVETPAGNNIIRVAGRDVFDTYANDTVHKALLFKMVDGTNHYTKVQSITLDGSDSLITVVSAVGQTVSSSTIVRISWVRLSRHATDSLSLEWVTESVAQTQLTMRTLEYNAAEIQLVQNGVAVGEAFFIGLSFEPGIPARNVSQVGAAFTLSATFAPGSASATANGSASGAAYTINHTFAPGTASAVRNASAPGAAYTINRTFAPGTASIGANGSASGAAYTINRTFAPGTASGVRNASASGAAYTISRTFTPGVASGVRNATASGAVYTVTVTFAPGVASGAGSAANTAMVAGRMVAAGMVGG